MGDGRFSFAPGSQIPDSAGGTFGCQSCHDPHGRYRILDTTGTISTTGLPIKSSGSYGVDPTNGVYAVGVYRLLGGIGYVPKSYIGGPAFSQDPMFAAAPSNYNQTETSYYGTRVAYGKNSSEWCANCHKAMHQNLSNVTNAIVHPAGEHILGPEISDNYNKYVYTGLTNGVQANAFLSLVPFQVGNLAQNSLLKAYQGRDNGGASNGASYTLGTTSSDRPTCLSCHRAHASAFDSISRWSNGNEFLTVGNTTGVVSYPDPTANPGRQWEEAWPRHRLPMVEELQMYGRLHTRDLFATSATLKINTFICRDLPSRHRVSRGLAEITSPLFFPLEFYKMIRLNKYLNASLPIGVFILNL